MCKVKHRYGLEGMFPESESVSTSLCPVAPWGQFCHEFVFQLPRKDNTLALLLHWLKQWTTALGMLLAPLPATPQINASLIPYDRISVCLVAFSKDSVLCIPTLSVQKDYLIF